MADQAPTQKSSAAPAANWLGYALGALGGAMFATKGIVIKLAMIENVDAVTTLTWRMIIATPVFIFIGWLGYRHRRALNPDFSISRSQTIKSLFVGMLGYYVASYMDFQGLQFITAQFDRLILLTYPFYVMLFGALWFGRKITWPTFVSLLVSYSGLALIFAHDLSLDGSNVIIGALLVTGASMSFAMYQLLAKPLIDQMGARLFTSIAMTGAGAGVLLQFFLTHAPSDIIVSQNAMWLMLAIGTVSTVAPAYLISAAIGLIGPQPTSIMGNVSPLVTIALAVTILQEEFSIYHAFGAVLVIAGILVFSQAEKRATQTAAQRMSPKL